MNHIPLIVLLAFLLVGIIAVKLKDQRLGEDCDVFNWCAEGLTCKDYRCVPEGSSPDNVVAWAPEGPKCDFAHRCTSPLVCFEHRCVHPDTLANNSTDTNHTDTNITLVDNRTIDTNTTHTDS